MAEQATVAPTQAEPKQTANNIAKGISDRAKGRSPDAAPPSVPTKTEEAKLQTPPATDPNAGKKKYVVDGQEVWLTPTEADTWVQKAMGYEKKLSKMSHVMQENAALMQALINDPLKVLKNISQSQNIPIAKLYEKILDGDWPDEVKEIVGQRYYTNAVEPLKLTPEQLKAREDAKWRAQREQQDKMTQEQAVIAENKRRADQAGQQVLGFVREAMTQSGLPDINTPLGVEMARKVIEVSRVASKSGRTITPKEAIEHVLNDMHQFQVAHYDHLDGEALVKRLGEKNAEKVKNYFLDLAKKAGSTPPPNVAYQKRSSPNDRKTKGLDEFHDYLDERKKNG